ncbi:hypothetical protein HYPSUDRAFT_214338 [Hypholoma sublateritium FD-334 SS-4]|uniref:Uncharacterized protein n=1 Tax=Hypholoma sublateritium (strain FD-334 SS-4) TaxID=945553 RepID=A0A0D2P7Z3_HYPSF|nr:hypothetical protein HYPSUDRAFT_214338 [Hypholoma sublateritium FD-334 SS-4]
MRAIMLYRRPPRIRHARYALLSARLRASTYVQRVARCTVLACFLPVSPLLFTLVMSACSSTRTPRACYSCARGVHVVRREQGCTELDRADYPRRERVARLSFSIALGGVDTDMESMEMDMTVDRRACGCDGGKYCRSLQTSLPVSSSMSSFILKDTREKDAGREAAPVGGAGSGKSDILPRILHENRVDGEYMENSRGDLSCTSLKQTGDSGANRDERELEGKGDADTPRPTTVARKLMQMPTTRTTHRGARRNGGLYDRQLFAFV